MAKKRGKASRRDKKSESDGAAGVLPDISNKPETAENESTSEQSIPANDDIGKDDSVVDPKVNVDPKVQEAFPEPEREESKPTDPNDTEDSVTRSSQDYHEITPKEDAVSINDENREWIEQEVKETAQTNDKGTSIKEAEIAKEDENPLNEIVPPVEEPLLEKQPIQEVPKKRLSLQERLALAAAKGSKKPSRSATPVVLEKEESPVVLEKNDSKILDEGPSTYEEMTKEELIEALWKKTIDMKSIEKANETLVEQNRSLTEKVSTLERKTPGDKKSQEKDQIIKELLEEGAKLSAKEVNLTQSIKKMRQHEKDLEEQVFRLTENEKTVKESLDSLQTRSKEFEKAEKSLSERDSLIEKISENLETATSQREELGAQLKMAQKSVQRLQRAEDELKDKTKTIGSLEKQLENVSIQISLLKQQGKQANNDYDVKLMGERQKAEKMKLEFLDEIQRLETKLETLRTHNEGMGQEENDTAALSKALRSNEFLQTQFTQAQENWKFIETSYLGKISHLENDISILRQKEMELNKKIRTLQADVQAKSEENEDLYQSQQELNKRLREVEDNLGSTLKELEVQNGKMQEMEIAHLRELERINNNMENDFTSSSSYFEYEPPRRNSALSEIGLGESSTTPAIGNSGFFDHSDDGLTMRAASQTGTNIQLAQRLSSTIQRLEMEIMALRDEVEALETEKSQRNSEMLQMMKESDMAREYKQKLSVLQSQIADTNSQYEACLELLGEKSERVQELQADVQDLKDLCRQQVEQLVSMS